MDMCAVFYDDGRHPGDTVTVRKLQKLSVLQKGRGGIPKIYEELSHVKAFSPLHHDVFI